MPLTPAGPWGDAVRVDRMGSEVTQLSVFISSWDDIPPYQTQPSEIIVGKSREVMTLGMQVQNLRLLHLMWNLSVKLTCHIG